ncbi:MAG: hypothetical protein QFB87_04480 [Patescibacteria group bacterium]|nr:hypothetical protein [Patescibacteria group bacterium]
MQPYATQNLITVSGFKSRNPEIDVSAWNDTTISGFISTASRSMQNYCEVDSFLTQTVSGEQQRAVINNIGDLVFYPRVRPIKQGAVTGMRLVKGGFSTSLILASGGLYYYNCPYPYTSLVYAGGYLAATGTLLLGGTRSLMSIKGSGVMLEVDYSGGFITTPEDLQDACDLWVRDIVTRRLNPLGAQEVKQGSFSYSRMTRSSNPKANQIESIYIQQAKILLDQGGYRRVAPGA